MSTSTVTPPEENAVQKSDATETAVQTQPEAQKVETAAPKTILIVEDTVELGEVIQATLERMGMKTFHETHGAKAIEVFKSHNPDVVLLDIGLPDMIGWKLMDTFKELRKDSRPHFIIITAYGDPANRLMGKLQDVDSYLIKPFTPDEVERVVNKVLGAKGSETPQTDTKKESETKPDTKS